MYVYGNVGAEFFGYGQSRQVCLGWTESEKFDGYYYTQILYCTRWKDQHIISRRSHGVHHDVGGQGSRGAGPETPNAALQPGKPG